MMAAYKETSWGQGTMEDLLEKVDRYITLFAACPSKDPKIAQVIAHASEGRGKLLRPRMLLFCAGYGPDFERRREVLCKLAAIVEMVHMSSLIHDDIVDDSDQRRGKPTVQHRYGKKAAVYAGDLLMSRMIEQVCKEELTRAAAILARTMGQMCLGEIGQSCCLFREDVRLSQYLENIHGKTAALFMAACRIGAEESGCSQKLAAQLERFGECFGMAFQLRDDLLDLLSDEGHTGKDTHKDLREGVYTYPLLYVLEKKEGRKKLLPILTANREGRLTKEQVNEMEQIVIQEQGIEGTKAALDRYVDQAKKIVCSLKEEHGPAAQMLALMEQLAGGL